MATRTLYLLAVLITISMAEKQTAKKCKGTTESYKVAPIKSPTNKVSKLDLVEVHCPQENELLMDVKISGLKGQHAYFLSTKPMKGKLPHEGDLRAVILPADVADALKKKVMKALPPHDMYKYKESKRIVAVFKAEKNKKLDDEKDSDDEIEEDNEDEEDIIPTRVFYIHPFNDFKDLHKLHDAPILLLVPTGATVEATKKKCNKLNSAKPM